MPAGLQSSGRVRQMHAGTVCHISVPGDSRGPAPDPPTEGQDTGVALAPPTRPYHAESSASRGSGAACKHPQLPSQSKFLLWLALSEKQAAS